MKGDCFFRIQDKKFDVRGEAEDTTYAGWIQVEEWNWGMNNRAVSAGFQEGKLRGDFVNQGLTQEQVLTAALGQSEQSLAA